MLKDLTVEVNRLKAECSSLTEESRELTQEKNELKEEKFSLKADIQNLTVQYQQRHMVSCLQYLCLLLRAPLQCTTPHCNHIHFSEIIILMLLPIPAQHSCHIQPPAVLQSNSHHPNIHLLPTLLANKDSWQEKKQGKETQTEISMVSATSLSHYSSSLDLQDSSSNNLDDVSKSK
ncbi:hypothetical protein V6N13_127095 [Hibiscus sabdariffa]